VSRMTEEERCRAHERQMRIDAAFAAGDLDALTLEFEPHDRFPDLIADLAIGACLAYAIYHSPLSMIVALLDAGADPNFDEGDGFPPLIAAMSKTRSAPGATTRGDVHEILEILLSRGANPDQRGINDYTALHWAAETNDLRAIEILLAHGANPTARTRIDDYETPGELAVRAGHSEAAALLEAAEARHG
jgi:ankyrin repeat protein